MAVGVNNELKDDQPECIAGKLAIGNIFCNTEITEKLMRDDETFQLIFLLFIAFRLRTSNDILY